MRESGTSTRARRATRSVVSASQSAARASASAAGGATRVVHRLTGASGAGRTGLDSLIELTAASSLGDAFVAVALAGTLFFSVSVDQARTKIAVALLITMAPFAVLAPFIGPMLDKVQQGRRFILAGTLLARGLLCWGMAGAVQHNDVVTLLPAAFGVLVLQKAFGVTRSAIAPRLLPAEITLVTANARSALASLIASTVGGGAAAGIALLAGGGEEGATWVLRIGTVAYLAAMALCLRLPEGVDSPLPVPGGPAVAPGGLAAGPDGPSGPGARNGGPEAGYGGAEAGYGGPGAARDRAEAGYGGAEAGYGRPEAEYGRPGATRDRPGAGHGGRGGGPDGLAGGPDRHAHPPSGARGSQGTVPLPRPARRRWRFPRLGPVVGEAMGANAALRAFSGFMIFFLIFLLRTVHFGTVPDKLALGELVGASLIGGFIGTAIGAGLKSRAPQVIVFGMPALTAIVTALSAVFFGLYAALAVALMAALGQALVKLSLDSIVQREIGEEVRSSTFAASETLHQLSWVVGGLAGLLMSLTDSGVAGLTVAASCLTLALTVLLLRRRRRIVAGRRHLARPQMS
jgi:MFS family permease